MLGDGHTYVKYDTHTSGIGVSDYHKSLYAKHTLFSAAPITSNGLKLIERNGIIPLGILELFTTLMYQ